MFGSLISGLSDLPLNITDGISGYFNAKTANISWNGHFFGTATQPRKGLVHIPEKDMARGTINMEFHGEVEEDISDELKDWGDPEWEITHNRTTYKVKVNGAVGRFKGYRGMRMFLLITVMVVFLIVLF